MPEALASMLAAQDERGLTLLERVICHDHLLHSALMSCSARTPCVPDAPQFLFSHVMSAVVSYPTLEPVIVDRVLEYASQIEHEIRHWTFTRFVKARPPAQTECYLSPMYIEQYYGLHTLRGPDRAYVLCLIGDLLVTALGVPGFQPSTTATLVDYFVMLCHECPAILDFASLSSLLSKRNGNLTQQQRERIFQLLLDYPYSSATDSVILTIDCPSCFVRALADILLSDRNAPEMLRLQRATALLNRQARHLDEHIAVALGLLCSSCPTN